MPNLTLEQKLVKPALDANPVLDYDLVVFRKVGGGGLRFHSLLGPGDKLSLLDKLSLGSSLMAYAVTRDQNLRHKMTVPQLKSADHVGPFTLNLTLTLRIDNPQLVVAKLESDPLGRLEREIREVLGRIASRMNWSEVQASASDFEDQLLSSVVMDESGQRVPSLAFLQRFAAELGFELKGIQVFRQLPAEVGEAARVLLRELKEQLQTRQEEFQAWRANAFGNIQQLGAISASAINNLSKVLEQIADKVDTAPALRSVMNELLAIRHELAMISDLGGNLQSKSSRELKILGTASDPALLGSAPDSGLSGAESEFLAWRKQQHRGSLADSIRELSRICAEEGYTLEVPSRKPQGRPNPFAEDLDVPL